jgi:hypothetical protein
MCWIQRSCSIKACPHLAKIRVWDEKLRESEVWTTYITVLCVQSRSLLALNEELAKAGL